MMKIWEKLGSSSLIHHEDPSLPLFYFQGMYINKFTKYNKIKLN